MSSITEIIHAIDDGTVPDATRRKVLLTAASLMGSAGLIATGVPFVASLQPSELARARGGPVDLDLATLSAGELRTVEWRGKPVWLMRRTEEMVRALHAPNDNLADPLSARSEQPPACRNATRSEHAELFVAVGVCTHLGCSPTLLLSDAALNAELRAPGGFLCPCHGSRFDLAGRVVKNVPAPTNLDIPDYRFTSATTLTIG